MPTNLHFSQTRTSTSYKEKSIRNISRNHIFCNINLQFVPKSIPQFRIFFTVAPLAGAWIEMADIYIREGDGTTRYGMFFPLWTVFFLPPSPLPPPTLPPSPILPRKHGTYAFDADRLPLSVSQLLYCWQSPRISGIFLLIFLSFPITLNFLPIRCLSA